MQRRRAVSRPRTIKRRRVAVVGRGVNKFRLVRQLLPTTFAGSSDERPRLFRRMAQDASVFINAVGAVVQLNAESGAAVPYLSIAGASADLPSAGASPLLQFSLAFQFALTDVLQSNELTAMYNEYQIRKIEVRFTLDSANTFTPGNFNTPNNLPSMYIAPDPNDAANPPAQSTVQVRGDCQQVELRHDRGFTMVLLPKAAQQLYSGALGTSYQFANSSLQNWIDSTAPSDSTPHYGLKAWVRNFCGAYGVGMVLRIQPIYHIACRRQR